MSVVKTYRMTCESCDFTTHDQVLMERHSCEVQEAGGRCEDWPCCSHERGDCQGLLYGSDEAIREAVHEAWDTGHGYCDHEFGIYQCGDTD